MLFDVESDSVQSAFNVKASLTVSKTNRRVMIFKCPGARLSCDRENVTVKNTAKT